MVCMLVCMYDQIGTEVGVGKRAEVPREKRTKMLSHGTEVVWLCVCFNVYMYTLV